MFPSVIPTSWKIAAVAVLVAASVAITFHFTSNSYEAEIGGLKTALDAANAAGKAKDEAIVRNNSDIKDLRAAIEAQNRGVDALKAQAAALQAKKESEISALRAQRHQDTAKIAELRAIKAPVVVIDGMSPEAVKAELASCRRAVLINEADGE